MAEIVREVEHLVDYGFVEIELLGQTVNHWREPGGSEDFADLLDRVASLPGVERLRFVTSYPRDFTARMIEGLTVSSSGMVAAQTDDGVVFFDTGGRRALTFHDGRAVAWAPDQSQDLYLPLIDSWSNSRCPIPPPVHRRHP